MIFIVANRKGEIIKMKKEYLVEVIKRTRCWVAASDEEEAKDLVEQKEADILREDDSEEIDSVEVIDEREVEDEDAYLEYLDDEEEDEDIEEW